MLQSTIRCGALTGNVFCVWHELDEPILRLLLRSIGDVAGVRRNVSG
jgi:hypothetical protein